MTRRTMRGLSPEDRILWNRVAGTVVPLKGRPVDPEPEPEPPAPAGSGNGGQGPVPRPGRTPDAASPPRPETVPRHLDRPLRQKLARGRLGLDAAIDLHGLTQAEAHSLLRSFLHQARAAGLRHVLVITGKGSSAAGEGVLRRAVPGWLATGPFRTLVSGYDEAGRRHGGGGALYVRLRRRPEERP